jgi:hypothetical protein
MYYDLLSKNKQTRKLLENYYGSYIKKLDEMVLNSPDEFKKVENILFESVQDRNELNPYFVIEFNRDMGEVENYFDRRSFHEDDLSLFDMISSNQERMQKVTCSSVSDTSSAVGNSPQLPTVFALLHPLDEVSPVLAKRGKSDARNCDVSLCAGSFHHHKA